MIEKQHDEITLMCDHCDVELGKMFDAEDGFREMIDYAKSEGWKITKDPLDDSEWVHQCSDCALESNNKKLGLF